MLLILVAVILPLLLVVAILLLNPSNNITIITNCNSSRHTTITSSIYIISTNYISTVTNSRRTISTPVTACNSPTGPYGP